MMDKFSPYLRLLRLPTVFTAQADIFLGFLLTHSSLEPMGDFGWLLAASSCLYLSGMVFNDVFDRHIDAIDRPGRPIPSGRVSAVSAVVLGIVLVLSGVGAAGAVGPESLKIASILTLLIFAYDGILKRTPLGPPAMGGCRFLNVMLGASAATVWAEPQTIVAAGLGIYIVGVTWFARTEAKRSSHLQLAGSMGVVNLGLAVLAVFVGTWGRGAAEPAMVLLLLAVIILTINRRLFAAVFDPVPERVQLAVRVMLLSLVMLDAALVYFKTGEPIYAVATAALLAPAMILARWIPVT